jgi:D-glycero-alpha-D-manno-heptose-7-phosphate kinase
MYETALRSGALGGKITGAGGGGFLLLFVPPEHRVHVRESLTDLLHVPFELEPSGSRVIFYDEDPDYSTADADSRRRSIVTPREMDHVRIEYDHHREANRGSE